MPYSNSKQPVAIFLNLKRRKGAAAAKAFAEKHSADMSKGARAAGSRPYKARTSRSK